MHDPPAVEASAESTSHLRARIRRLRVVVTGPSASGSFRSELDAAEIELLRRLAQTAAKHLQALAAAPPGTMRAGACAALHAFGEAQRAAEPNEIPDLPGWGPDREPAPERVADRIEAGEGDRAEIAAYAAALDTWTRRSAS